MNSHKVALKSVYFPNVLYIVPWIRKEMYYSALRNYFKTPKLCVLEAEG